MNTAFQLLIITACCCCACISVGERNVDSGALAKIRQFHKAEGEFYSRYQRYGTLSDLEQASLISGGQQRTGTEYTYVIEASSTAYHIEARPLDKRHAIFESDQTLAVHRK